MRNIRLQICYDGTRYQGWQRLKSNDNTVQGKLEDTLSRLLGEEIRVIGSGRTDAGVHAQGQVANFHTETPMDCREILIQLRGYLPEDIGIESCKEVSDRFHARLNAQRKTYCYRIWNSDRPCVFVRRFVHVLPEKLNLEQMRHAAQTFLGTHDFSAFCANAKMKKSTVRTLYSLDIVQAGDEVRILVTGNGFLLHMVRILAGTLVEVGLGQRDAGSVSQLFGKKRERAGITLPAKGLCLMEVEY